MDDSKIAKRTEQIIQERGCEPELASSIAKDEAITEETSNYIAKIWQHLKVNLKGAIEISAEVNTPNATDIDEKTAWSQFTAEQFFSGYSEADAIYDNL